MSIKITRVEQHHIHWRTVAIDLDVHGRAVRVEITQTSDKPPELSIRMPLGMQLPEYEAFRTAVAELAREWELKYGNVLAELDPHAPFSLRPA
jgi:hypothetical protein